MTFECGEDEFQGDLFMPWIVVNAMTSVYVESESKLRLGSNEGSRTQ